MQAVSGSWATTIASSDDQPIYSAQMCWPLTLVTSNFFTIGTSIIGGPDIIKSGGGAIAFFDSYQYTDYTPYLASYSVSQSIGQYPYGIMIATASVEFDNSSNLFSPGYDPTIGDYIAPTRPLKLSLGFNGESLQQFMGFTDQPILDQSDLNISMTASDVLNYVSNFTSQLSDPLIGYTTDQIIAAALEEIGFSSSQYVLDASLQQPIGIMAPYGQRWGDLLQYLCEAEQGLLFVDEYGIVRFWNRQHFTNNTTVVWDIDWSSIENLTSESTPIFNDVTVVANPRAVQPNQLVWQQGSSVLIPAGQSYQYEIDFSDDDGDLPVPSVDEPVGNATSGSSYTVNTADDGSGTDVTGSVTISAVAPLSTTYLITFQNSSGADAYITSMNVYGTPATVTDHISIEFKDDDSIALYGTNPGNNGYVLEIDNDYVQDTSTAQSLAYSLVLAYKDGRTRYLAYTTANPAIQIGDLIQVTNTDTAVVKQLYVVGRTVTLGNDELTYQLELEEREAVHYFTIGSSLIGGTDTIAP